MSSSRTEANPATPGGEAEQVGGTLVSMPQMGISVSEGTILEWRKSVGDQVAADEPICEVTTDKVDVEIPCPAAGVLAKILVEPGETVAVGTPIAEIDSGGGTANGAAPIADEPAVAPAPHTNGENDRSAFVSPVVRRIAEEHAIDLSQVEGHGIGGRIRKKDLVAFLDSGPTEKAERPLHIESPYVPDAPVPAELGGRREEMTPMRKAIAEHMVRSRHTAAHCTTIVEVDFAAVAAQRAELKESYSRRGVPLTYLAFVARAVVEALEEFPIVNASVDGSDIVFHDDVNLGIAVALDEGLIVPVINQAQRLSLEGMAVAIADLATRARERRLTPDEVQGGTFTITNPGQFGAVLATPIINQPQVAILDLEAIVKRPVVVTRTVAAADAERSGRGDVSEDSIAIRPMAYLPMSWDHRALDGADAARFLGSVKAKIETGAVR